MSEDKPNNEIELAHEEVGAEGYITRKNVVIIKSHDLSTVEIIKQAEEQMKKLREAKYN